MTKADMIRLTELRTITRLPITKLIHEAVGAYYRLLTEARESTDSPRCCEKPLLQWKGVSASNCSIECLSCGFVLCDDGQLADWHDPEEIEAERELMMAERLTATPPTSAPNKASQPGFP
jgi:hypothetical protein